MPRRALLGLLSAAVAGCAAGPVLPVPRIDDQPCPPFDRPEDRAVCSHTDGAGGIDVSVSPSTVSTAAESLAAVRLLLENGTDASLRYDPSHWRLSRNAGLRWTGRDAVIGGPRDVETIPPGGAASWSGLDALFDLGNADRTPAGLYAAVLPVERGPTAASGERVACVFLFRVGRD